MKSNKFILCSSLVLLLPNIGWAVETKWSGFLSASIGKTLDKDTTYLVDPVTAGAYDDQYQSEPESMVGIQMQSMISDKVRTTVQMLAKGYQAYDVSIDLAFVSYSLTDTVTLNAGRFRIPFYYYSDFIDVGYAYHWIRAPMDFYSIPHTSLDGGNIRYADYLFGSDVEFEAQIWYGNSDVTSISNGEESTLNVRKDIGISTTFTWNWLKFRLLHNEKEIGFPPAEGQPEFEPFDTKYDSLGFMVDYENFIFRSEYAELKNGFSPNPTPSWYASVGYQIGDFLPHLTLSENDAAETLDFANFDQNDIMTFNNIDQVVNSTTVGLRWDVHTNTALKIEYITRETETKITHLFLPISSNNKDEVNMFAISLDVVF